MYSTRLVAHVIDTIVGLVAAALLIRLLLRFLGANPNTRFVQWIYEATAPLMAPFANIFPSWQLGYGYVLDISVLVAMIAYGILGWIIMHVIALIFGRMPVTNRDL